MSELKHNEKIQKAAQTVKSQQHQQDLKRRATRLLRHVPVTITLTVLMWVLYAIFGSTGREILGYNLPADETLWHLATAGLTTWNLLAAVCFTLAAVLFAVPAEYTLGSARFAVAAAGISAFSLPAGFILGSAVERAGFNRWGPDLTNEVFCSPVAWILGPLALASAQMGVLWRRRLRIVLIALTGTLVLYHGSLSDVVALTAVVVGWIAGEALRGPAVRSLRMSLRESRVLVAVLLTAVAVGPVITALNPAAQGPFAGVSQLMWEPTVAAHEVLENCSDLTSTECAEAVAINQQHGLGPLLLNLVPLAITLVLARGLTRGRRLAWLLAVVETIASIGVIVSQIAGDGNDALTHVNVGFVVLPWVIALVALLASWRRFPVASPWSGAALRTLGAFAVTAAVWVVGAVVFRDGFVTGADLGSALAELPARYLPPAIAVQLPHHVFPRSGAAWALYEWVGIIFWAFALVVLHRALSAPPSASAAAERARAREVLMRGTGDHLAWMGLWAGNRYFFAEPDCEGRSDEPAAGALPAGYVAYRVSHNIAVTVGGPVYTRESSADEIAAAFEEFAAAQGWRVAWYSVDETFARPGFRTIHVAEESLLYTDNLEFKGKKFQNIRTARNRAQKEGVRAVWTTWAECSVERREAIAALSEQWVSDKALPEMGFTLGGLEELRDADTTLLLALSDDGQLHAVTSWLPVYEGGELAGYTLDFMRRDPRGFRPAVEFLLAEAAVIAGGEGLAWVSLSGAPLARSDEPTSLTEVLLEKTGATIEPLYGFRSLAASKHKFHPTHRGWYLAYDDELALANIALAVVSCYLPNMRAGDVVSAVREFFAAAGNGGPSGQQAQPQGRAQAGRAEETSPAPAPTPRP